MMKKGVQSHVTTSDAIYLPASPFATSMSRIRAEDWKPRGAWEAQQEVLRSSHVAAFRWGEDGRPPGEMHGGSQVHRQVVREQTHERAQPN